MNNEKRLSITICFTVFMLFIVLAQSCSYQDNNKSTNTIQIERSISQISSKTRIVETISPKRTSTGVYISPTTLNTIENTGTVTTTKPESLLNNRYLLINEFNQDVLLVDSQNGNVRLLESDMIFPKRVISISSNGCSLISLLKDGRIVQLDLQGKLLREYLSADWHHGSGVIGVENISPSEEWMAYIVGEGIQGYDSFSIQNVETINLTDKSIYKLTKNGGSSKTDWSPNGIKIAFSEFDNNSIDQIYISNANGTEKYKITSLDNSNTQVEMMRWSPNGEMIAFQSYDNATEKTSLAIVNIKGNAGLIHYYPEIISPKYFWWKDNEILVVEGNYTESSIKKQNNESYLFWLNVFTGEIIDSINELTTIDKLILFPRNYGDSLVGYFSDRNFIIYDPVQRTENKLFERYYNITDWLISPSDYPGEDKCILK